MIVKSLPTKASAGRFLIIVASLLLLTTRFAEAQSDTTFQLRQTADLADERGYMGGKTISVDGKLAISESNGSPSYIYPISSYTKNGYPIRVDLSYCGAVNFTTFAKYTPYSDNPPFGAVKQAWNRFDQSRPAWIIGVNGFAIQVLWQTTAFHTKPSLINGAFDKTASTRTVFNDQDLPWAIDGYDYGNRMKNLASGIDNGALPANDYVDVIHLLKSDGSVLELRNSKRTSDPEYFNSINDGLFTGYYHVNEANSKAYAIVELDSSIRPNFLYYATGDSNVIAGVHVLQPRRVHYFPGDGTELTFVEEVMPYGVPDYLSVLEPYGGMLAGPTIFYLESINSNAGRLVTFKRSRHTRDDRFFDQKTGQFDPRKDSTRGRSLTTLFDDHEITYDAKQITIQAFGRTTLLKIGDVVGSGGASETEGVPFQKLGYPAQLAQDLAGLGLTSDYHYNSYLGYVTEIVDAANRSTVFEYEQVLRRYLNPGFPYTPGSGTLQVNLRNLRLKQVTEPTARYVITYNNDQPNSITPYGVNDWIEIKSRAYGLSETKEPWLLNNQVRKVEKYDCSGLLLTDDYSFVGEGGKITSSKHRTTDAIDSTVREKRFRYAFDDLPDVIPSLPRGRFTRVLESVDSTKGYVAKTITSYDTVTPFVRLPKIVVDSVNGVAKTRTRYSYTLTTARTFGGDTALANAYGKDIALSTEQRGCACDTADTTFQPGTTTVTAFRYLPEFFKVDNIVRGRINLRETLRRYDSAFPFHNVPFDSVMWEDNIIAYYPPDTLGTYAPPVSGLEVYKQVSDGLNLIRTSQSYSEDQYLDTVHTPRGRLLADSTSGRIGNGSSSELKGSRHEYRFTSGRWLATGTNNGLGARAERDWSFDGKTGKVIDNRDSVWSVAFGTGNQQHALAFESPTVERALVRKPTVSGGVRTDTLSTLYDRTFYGQASLTVDPNGWLTQVDYDTIGRVKTAWLPYDFATTVPVDTFRYNGYKRVDLYGLSLDTIWHDTMICHTTPYRQLHPVFATPEVERRFGTMVIDHPPVVQPSCDGCAEAQRKGDGSSTLTTCWEQPFLWVTPSVAHVSARILPKGTTSIVSLDSAWVDLLITKRPTGCMNVILTIPQFSFTRTYVFGCPPGSGNGQIASGGTSSGSFMILPEECETSLTPIYAPDSSVRFRIKLTNLKDSIRAAGNRGEQLAMRLSTSTVGGSMELSSDFYEDYRPQLILKGAFATYSPQDDYTLKYGYDDGALAATINGKVDDSRHTASHLAPSVGTGTYILRHGERKIRYGGDYRIRKSFSTIGNPASPIRTDSTVNTHNGLGGKIHVADPDGDVVSTTFDGLGRPVQVTNADGTVSRISYYYGTAASFGLPPMTYVKRHDCAPPQLSIMTTPILCDSAVTYVCPFISEKVVTDENGTKSVQYFDSMDRLRREVADSGGLGHLNLTTTYDYDEMGRMTRVINPKGDTTRYVYDKFGRIRFKEHPDLGVISYSYDRLGNVRFSQTQQQADSARLGYTEYDDLGRVTLVGEASIGSSGGLGIGGTKGSSGGEAVAGRSTKKGSGSSLLLAVDVPGFARLTDSLDANYLHNGLIPISGPTANTTLYLPVSGPVPPTLPSVTQFDSVYCGLTPNVMLGETDPPVGPFLKHPVQYYQPITAPGASRETFENIAVFPHFVRTAVCYDTFPDRNGAVWAGLPTRGRWDSLAPKGKLRNLKGHEVAVAYREHGGEPFHYVMMSFDERGRPEMLARWTENLGFDAVYYTYNSANQVTSIRVADPIRQYTTWYGYDWNGRVDSVWTELGPVWSGLGVRSPRYPAPGTQPSGPDITYEYRKGGQVSRMTYPPVMATVDYAYTKRKWIDSISAVMITPPPFPMVTPVFKEVLSYDPSGQIIKQRSRHMTNPENVEIYRYDSVQRLVRWIRNTDSVSWGYDKVGNRMSELKRVPFSGLQSDSYSYGGWSAGGSNRLSDVITQDTTGAVTGVRSYGYNPNGSTVDRFTRAKIGGPIVSEDHFAYSYRELTRQYISGNPASPSRLDWRYRYSSGGEREQKRLYYGPNGDENGNAYPWVYYLLGGAKSQLAVYHGQQTLGACGDASRRVYVYPTEYITTGVGYTGIRETIMPLVTTPTGAKRFRISDHLASLREEVTLSNNSEFDYSPWGVFLSGLPSVRATFNDQERDLENSLFDLGLRKFDPSNSSFGSVDALWERNATRSPYVYCNDNPLRYTDPAGLQVVAEGEPDPDPTPVGGGEGPVNTEPERTMPLHEDVTPEGEDAPPHAEPAPKPLTNEQLRLLEANRAAQNPHEQMEQNSGTSRSAAFRMAKEAAGIPRSEQPSQQYSEKLRDQSVYTTSRVYRFDEESKDRHYLIKEHSLGHAESNPGDPASLPHFNLYYFSNNGQSISIPFDNHFVFGPMTK